MSLKNKVDDGEGLRVWRGFLINAGGQKAWIFVICVGFVYFASGDGGGRKGGGQVSLSI